LSGRLCGEELRLMLDDALEKIVGSGAAAALPAAGLSW